ncbi:hypothetical protein OQA88_5530 [Cercophora sp. LCS_1]
MLSMTNALGLAITAAAAALVYFLVKLRAKRQFYCDLPKPPHSFFWGHLKLMGEYMDKAAPGNYLQAPLTQMKFDYDLPDIWYLDLWPLGPEMLICTTGDAAAVATTVTTFPQAPIVIEFLNETLGGSFIESTNGSLWKELHHMLAPGLTPNAVRSYHQLIVDEAKLFHKRLHNFATKGNPFNLHLELGKFPFEVIWQVFFGENLNTQVRGSQIYDDSVRLNDVAGITMNAKNPITKWQAARERAMLIKRLDVEADKRLRARFVALRESKTLPTRTTATTLLDRMLLSHVQNGQPLDEQLIKLIKEKYVFPTSRGTDADFPSAKGFLVAGSGTTADMSSYAIMLLSNYPDALRKLREEHDHVFGKEFDGTVERLLQDSSSIKGLEYTDAVIQETMRLFPVGMLCRGLPEGQTTFDYKGKAYPIENHQLTLLSYAMHYDPSNFEDPQEFKPERFLGPEPAHSRNSYRPFERGLRSCIGQHLAMDEMRVLLILTARWFDFELRDHNPSKQPRMSHTKMDTILGNHGFQSMRFTAGPTGPVTMKVTRVNRA